MFKSISIYLKPVRVMKLFFAVLLFLITSASNISYAQKTVDRVKFFEDTSVINATLTFNIKKVLANKAKEGIIFPAMFSCKLNDTSKINDPVSITVRGHFRRGYCYLPPLWLTFNDDKDAAFHKLKTLKLVSSCMTTHSDDQNLLKEYMIYKIYNMITDKSFRVRLLNLNYQDSSGKKKTMTQHAFLLEDIKQVAKRTDCESWKGKNVGTEATDRRQMTMVAIFEYMIANTDWSVPVNHNTKLLHSKTDSLSRPYVVPYDFDSSGLVNTTYAGADERLGISSVRERLYRGFPRSMEELKEVLAIYNEQKTNIYAAINNFSLFTSSTKKEMTDYLDEFYTTINDPAEIKATFITGARRQ
jgi:hypothetical protein